MAIPQQFLDELIARTDIVDLVNRYVPLKRKGANYWACCPFHHERTPSFSVTQDKQFFKCFGCGEGGNAIHFLMKIENLPYIDAVRKLAEMNGMELPEEEDGGKGRLQRQRLLALNKDAARYFYETLTGPRGKEALQYLLNRGMTPQIIVRFGLGYAEDNWDSFLRAMRQKGYTDLELESARLAGRTKNGRLYPFFRGRVMFPIIDIRGDVVAFGGRVIRGDGEGRKYVNSSDTPVYSKSRTLYAMNLAKKTKADQFILCEGNIDVIALHQAGFDSAVASCGTAFTAEQARLLSKYTKEVVICYDADAAGQKATEKAIDILNQNGLNVRVLRLPPRRDEQGRILYDSEGRPQKVDPDDFLRINGPEAFRALLDKPQTDGQYRMGEIRKKYDDLSDDQQRLAYLKEAAGYISTLSSPIERESFCLTAAQEASFNAESVRKEVERIQKARHYRREKELQKEAQQPEKRLQPKEWSLRYTDPQSAVAEEQLVAAVLGDRELAQYAQVRLDPEQFSSPFLAKVYRAVLDRVDQGLDPDPACCMMELEEAERRHLTAILGKQVGNRLQKPELSALIGTIQYQEQKRNAPADDAELLREAVRRKQG